MFTVKTNFGQHRVSVPSAANDYLHSQFPDDIKTILNKLESIECLLTQLVDITSSYDFQPPIAEQKYESIPSSTINSVIQGTVSELRDSITGATEFLLDEGTSSNTSLVQIIKATDVHLSEFLDYRQYLQDPTAAQNLTANKNGPLITTPEELQAFDEYLQENDDKLQLFKIFLQTKMYKCNDMEKLIRSLIADEIFLEYNFAGALGKQSLGQMVLFENLLFNVCYNGENQEEYINELKKIIHRAKNRIYKNRSITKAKEQQEMDCKSANVSDEAAVNAEVANINDTFISALSNNPSSSSAQLFPISDAIKFEAFDRLLKSDPNKLEQFKQFVRMLMVKYEDPDKVLLDIISADVYLKYNYSGTSQKRALKDMIVFQQVFHEICFRNLTPEDYVSELKKIILRNKNRAYKSIRMPELNRREAIIAEEDELLDNFEYWLETELNQSDLANSRVFPITTPARLEALDEALRNNPQLKILMNRHVERYLERYKTLDKVLPRFVDDEVFMEYNYAGVWGKNTLKDMVLFEKILYETCYRAQPFQIYVKELIRVVQVSKNRVHRKNANKKKLLKEGSDPNANEGMIEDVLAEDAMEEFEDELNKLQGKDHLLDSKLFPISTSTNLKAFDKCLQADPERRTQFALFLRKIAPSLDKVVEKLIKDELFTQYNYQGIKGKKPFSSLVLFDQVLFEAYGESENMNFQKYIRRIKKICRRASNRLNKKRFCSQRKAMQSSDVLRGQIINGEMIFETVDIETEVIETDDEEDDMSDE